MYHTLPALLPICFCNTPPLAVRHTSHSACEKTTAETDRETYSSPLVGYQQTRLSAPVLVVRVRGRGVCLCRSVRSAAVTRCDTQCDSDCLCTCAPLFCPICNLQSVTLSLYVCSPVQLMISGMMILYSEYIQQRFEAADVWSLTVLFFVLVFLVATQVRHQTSPSADLSSVCCSYWRLSGRLAIPIPDTSKMPATEPHVSLYQA